MTYGIKKLENHPYAQCYVEMTASSIVFISYTTAVIIAKWNDDNCEWEVYCNGTYSQTTRKQIGWFLREWFPNLNYYDMKACAESGSYCVGQLA